MTVQQTMHTENGIDVDALRSTVDAIAQDPQLAKSRFHIHNTWISGGHNQSTITSFYGAKQENEHLQTFTLDADEPPILAGQDIGPNPVEHLLNALAACVTTGMVYHAAIRGIHIEELESHLEGDIDLRGFLGLSNEVRKGYENIRVTFKVKTDAENLERLKAFTKFSPVLDVVSHGTNVDIRIESK
ncbi:MAG: OsmC family protein [Sedimentisphaerales bacterium]|nr:OsmC family protein [Sedimentisphaerales bacterium]